MIHALSLLPLTEVLGHPYVFALLPTFKLPSGNKRSTPEELLKKTQPVLLEFCHVL